MYLYTTISNITNGICTSQLVQVTRYLLLNIMNVGREV